MFYSADVRHERFWRVGIARNAVCFRSFVASKARKGRSEKRGGAEDRVAKMLTKFAPRLRARAIRKSKSLKTDGLGAPFFSHLFFHCPTSRLKRRSIGAQEIDAETSHASDCLHTSVVWLMGAKELICKDVEIGRDSNTNALRPKLDGLALGPQVFRFTYPPTFRNSCLHPSWKTVCSLDKVRCGSGPQSVPLSGLSVVGKAWHTGLVFKKSIQLEPWDQFWSIFWSGDRGNPCGETIYPFKP